MVKRSAGRAEPLAHESKVLQSPVANLLRGEVGHSSTAQQVCCGLLIQPMRFGAACAVLDRGTRFYFFEASDDLCAVCLVGVRKLSRSTDLK